MGFHSSFITSDYPIAWPEWFRDKYQETVAFQNKGIGALNSRRESKAVCAWDSLHEDIQKAIDWGDFCDVVFVVVYLHECGGITRCQIMRDSIKWSEPDAWTVTEGINHDHCYGCSDVSSELKIGDKL